MEGGPNALSPIRRSWVWKALVAGLAAVVLLAVAVVVRRSSTPRRPNLLLITIDTLRADHVSSYGYRRTTTACLDGVARQGALFETAYAPMPTTGPSHATLFTSLRPYSHGVLTNGVPLDCAEPTLSEVLASSGYETAAVVSSFVLSRQFRWDRGFGHFDDSFVPKYASVVTESWEGIPVPGRALDQRATQATDKAIAWLAGRKESGRPFFLWVHYFDPHTPYDPPAGDLAAFADDDHGDPLRAAVRRYDGEIHYADREIGRLLRYLDSREEGKNLVLVIAGDHGEALMDHGHVHHGLSLYEEEVRVPLILRYAPRIKPGTRISEPVELLDVRPTLFDLLGVDARALPTEGRSLVPLLTGNRLEPRDIFLQRRTYPPGANDNWYAPPWLPPPAGHPIVGGLFAVREGAWKYIEAPQAGTRELYDLATDPTERRNLAASQAAVAARLQARLSRWLAATPRRGTLPPHLSEEDRARLRSLGYLE